MAKETYISDCIGDLEFLITSSGEEQARLIEKAGSVRREQVGEKVYFRGLIEFSNICGNPCPYCGINRDRKIDRYRMSPEEVVDAARFCIEYGCVSLVLQSGEERSGEFTGYVEDILGSIFREYPGVSVTLSAGEQDRQVYRRFRRSGAERYLLRIESSERELYRKLHHGSMSFEERAECIMALREEGFQVGTGVMIGLPGQSARSLARDLLFMRETDVDMVGMGPYIPVKGEKELESPYTPGERLSMTLNMTALLRLLMPDINIAAASALQALDPQGREKALKAGANVIMPLMTPARYRVLYSLYEGKPCLEERASDCLGCITGRVKSAGLIPAPGEKGDSLRYLRRVKSVCSG